MPTAYVSFSADINPSSTESLIALLSQQANQGITEVYLMLSTPGGSVMNGLNLYNVLRAMPFQLTTHNVGHVNSIGNAVFLAGDTRYACQHSTFMFHGVGLDVMAQTRLEEKRLRESLNSVMMDQNSIGSVICDRTNLSNRQVRNMFKEARTKNATDARTAGIIHDIREVNIPAGTPIFSLVFKR